MTESTDSAIQFTGKRRGKSYTLVEHSRGSYRTQPAITTLRVIERSEERAVVNDATGCMTVTSKTTAVLFQEKTVRYPTPCGRIWTILRCRAQKNNPGGFSCEIIHPYDDNIVEGIARQVKPAIASSPIVRGLDDYVPVLYLRAETNDGRELYYVQIRVNKPDGEYIFLADRHKAAPEEGYGPTFCLGDLCNCI